LFLATAALSCAQMATGTKYYGNILPGTLPPFVSFGVYFNQVTPENSGKWGTVESTRNVMNWSQMDSIYNYAKSRGYPLKQHTFVWGKQEPGWMTSLSAAEAAAEVEEWIRLFALRYPDVEYCDVVNEPFHAPPSFKNAIGGDGATGWDWVIWAFTKARQYLPNAKLLINEYSVLEGGVTVQEYANLINLLKARGLIDGAGLQCHLTSRGLSATTAKSRLDQLTSLTGVPLNISEYGIDSANDSTQLSIYQQLIPVFMEHPNVIGVTGWGYLQGYTWKANSWVLYANETTERPALTWLRGYLGLGGGTGVNAPSSLAGSSASTTQINLTWTDNSSNESSFEVERSTGNSAFISIAILGANVTAYSDTGLTAATTYSYRVRACNSTDCSSYSNTATVKTARR
jgi:endo-1,4-beta-xylanase